ncbi:MAG: RluA family pseudouridine synthase [Veillonellales bacterium]
MIANNRTYTITEAQVNKRLDVFLSQMLTEFSRSHVQKLIIDHQVTVNGHPTKANYKLRLEERVAVVISEGKPMAVEPEKIPLDILYEDIQVIVVNKPRGMVVHPATGNYSGTLVNALLEHCNDLSGINGTIRPGIVHRLDKDTSGVMVAAKTDRAHISLAKQIKERTASRRYLAIVQGNIKEEQGLINAPIGRDPNDRKKMAVTFTNSKTAITNFRVIKRFGKYTLVECKLLTGRTHQIRVHMTYIGHPVVGDPKYGPGKSPFSIQGQALHSTELTFEHPTTGQKLIFSAPMPADMQDILNSLTKKK